MSNEMTQMIQPLVSHPVIRCKMRVFAITPSLNHDGTQSSEYVRLAAVSGEDGTANGQWAKWTPAAQFDMSIDNPEAFGKLPVGAEFYVDFTPAD